jgi:hypothetical protein
MPRTVEDEGNLLPVTKNNNNSQIPAKRESGEIDFQQGTDSQAAIGYLPQTKEISADERVQLARAEGYDSLAIELALAPSSPGYADKIQLIFFSLVAIVLVIFFFPTERFFKPKAEDLGTMTIGGPTTADDLAQFDSRKNSWMKTLLEIDRLYFGEGKLTEAILLAESALERLDRKDWESWQKVHYRYWELLSAAGRVHTLKNACHAYLQVIPEDAFANYYYARAFLSTTDRVQSFSPEIKASYRQKAKAIIQQIENACNALNAQRKHPDAKGKESIFNELYQKLRLEQARIFVLIWKLGGYKEDMHGDVAYRDRALAICSSDELSNMKAAIALKITIYTHILDRWYWFEGQQIIAGRKFRKKDIEQGVDKLRKELEGAK